MLDLSTIASICAIGSSVGAGWYTLRKISKDAERHRKREAEASLEAAKDADLLLKTQLEDRMHDLESQLHNLKENVDKDIVHLKETYNGELKFLGQKIEELRSEVRNQHGQLVALLTKMIDKK